MPFPKIDSPDRIAISEDGKVKAKRLVQVVKPYRTIPDFYGEALRTAAAGKPKVESEPEGGAT